MTRLGNSVFFQSFGFFSTSNITTNVILLLVLFSSLAHSHFFDFENNQAQMASQDLKVGDKAPDFTAKTDANEDFTLSKNTGKYIVLYFYPKDFTYGCTKEACSFRDNFPKFKVGQDLEDSTIILGVSADTVETHKKFKEEYKLPYTLLADTDGTIRKLFGCKASFFGILEARKTFVVDKDGTIAYVYESQLDFNGHVTGALQTIEKLAKGTQESK